MARKSSPLSAEAIGPIGFSLILLQQPFTQSLRIATPTHFALQLCTGLGGFIFVSLVLGPLLLFIKIKNTSLETLRHARNERRQYGYWRYALFLWRLAVAADLLTFALMGFAFSTKLSYGQQFIEALLAATCVSIFHLTYIGFLDRWAKQPPPTNASATKQLNWLFRNNKNH